MTSLRALISDGADFRGQTHEVMSSVIYRSWAKASSSVRPLNG